MPAGRDFPFVYCLSSCFLLAGCSALPQALPPKLSSAPPIASVRTSGLVWTVRASVGPVFAAANDVIPKCSRGLDYCDNLIIQCEGAWANKGIWAWPAIGGGFKYSVWRWDDLQTTFDSNVLRIRQPLLYHAKAAVARGWPNPFDWTTVGSCGYHGQPGRGATIGLDSALRWDVPYWRLATTTTSYAGDFNPACKITFLSVDVSDKVKKIVGDQVSNVANLIDRDVPIASDVTAKVTDVWSRIQEPVQLATGYWFELKPTEVAVSAINFAGGNVQFSAALQASPSIVHSDEKPTLEKTLLPPLQQRKIDPAMHVRADGFLPLERMTRRLKSHILRVYRFRKQQDVPRDYQLHLVDASISGRGDTLVVKLTAKGGVWPFEEWGIWGELYLVGTPAYDPVSNMLIVRQLHLSDDSKKRLADQGYAPLIDALPRELSKAMQWPLNDKIEKLRKSLTQAFNLDLADGVKLHGAIEHISPVGVRIERGGVRVVVEIDGRLDVNIQAPEVPVSTQVIHGVCPN